jgi:hypothetical protein
MRSGRCAVTGSAGAAVSVSSTATPLGMIR